MPMHKECLYPVVRDNAGDAHGGDKYHAYWDDPAAPDMRERDTVKEWNKLRGGCVRL